MRCIIKPSQFAGEVFIPPSKSETMRALVFAAMGKGPSTIENILLSPDTYSMIDGLRSFGIKIDQEGSTAVVEGTGGCLKAPSHVIDVGNSGLALRFLMAFAAMIEDEVQITGDDSIKKRRPVKPLLDVYKQKGMKVYSFDETDNEIISIKGKISAGSMVIEGSDSQPVSSLLFSTAFLEGPSEIFVIKAGERPFVDMTLHWLNEMGAGIYREEYRLFEMEGDLKYDGFNMKVGGDFSTALFPIAAAIVTEGKVKVHGLDQKSLQGDKEALEIFRSMGASIAFDEDGMLVVECRGKLRGIEVDINHIIDTLPILAVLACFATSKTVIKGAEIARYKECNRITVMASLLQMMGGKIEERNDGLVIYPSSLIGTTLDAPKDHRVALSLMVAAAGAIDKSIIYGTESLVKTYPTAVYDFIKAGMKLDLSV
jgi:3-phosphoshikimate 1-carboxyvinyltransferase